MLDEKLAEIGFRVKQVGHTRIETDEDAGTTSVKRTVLLQFNNKKITIDLTTSDFFLELPPSFAFRYLMYRVDFIEAYDLEDALKFDDGLDIAEATVRYRELERLIRKVRQLCGDRFDELRRMHQEFE